MGGRNEITDQLQVHGFDDRDSIRRLHRGYEGGKVRLVSIGGRKSTKRCELPEVHDDRWLQRIARSTFGGIDAIQVDCLQRGSGRPIHRIRFVHR